MRPIHRDTRVLMEADRAEAEQIARVNALLIPPVPWRSRLRAHLINAFWFCLAVATTTAVAYWLLFLK